MTMRGPTPTTEEKRVEEENKRRAKRNAEMSKYYTGAGTVRVTYGNLLALFTHSEEWKGVLGAVPVGPVGGEFRTLVFRKRPPFGADYAEAGDGSTKEVHLTEEDYVRIAIWLEREGRMVIDTEDHLRMLRTVVAFLAGRPATG